MSLKQSRRTVSFSATVHAAAMRAAAAEGIACSEWVTRLIRQAIPGLPEMVHASEKKAPKPAYTMENFRAHHKMTRADVRYALVGDSFCAVCIDSLATHRGQIDKDGPFYALCDDCGDA